MKRILVISDLHGEPYWKAVWQEFPEDYYRIVFLSDYMDSDTRTTREIIENMKKIISFQKAYPEKVILLLGNHDVQYLIDRTRANYIKCTGYNKDLEDCFRNEIYPTGKFQAAYSYREYLFTHAGLSNAALREHFPGQYFINAYEACEKLNELWEKQDSSLFAIGKRRGGLSNTGSIFWADKSETENDSLYNIKQVVGHSRVKQVTMSGNMIYTDCLWNNPKGFFELQFED
jgi:predicted MPP superfamily phosphohydrolase